MSSATTHQKGNRFHPLVVLSLHLQAALGSLGRLFRNPIASLMTIAVIGIALALPVGLHILLDNIRVANSHWDGSISLSAFLKVEAPDSATERLAKRLQQLPAVEKTEVISKEGALQEFRRYSGFEGVMELLKENPLPAVILIKPHQAHSDEASVRALVTQLQQDDLIDQVQIDLQWVKRFAAITEIAKRGVLILGGLLGMAVLLVVGNTIRLEIQNRRSEIEIIKLIGGTNAFIRRPFLYTGFWYGLLGGGVAMVLIIGAAILLKEPINHLVMLYDSSIKLHGFDLTTLLVLSLGSPLLGLVGSFFSVGRHLSEIEPK